MKTSGLIATYDTHAGAEDSIREIDHAGFNMKRLSIIGKGYHSEEHPVGFYTVGDRMKTWGGVGAFWGALWGMLFGAAFFWIPGIGLLGAAGPFVHVLAGALEGAALVWVGLHQQRRLARWFGLLLQFGGGVAFVVALDSLRARGLVLMDDSSRTRTYSALPVGVYLENRRRELEERQRELETAPAGRVASVAPSLGVHLDPGRGLQPGFPQQPLAEDLVHRHRRQLADLDGLGQVGEVREGQQVFLKVAVRVPLGKSLRPARMQPL